MTPERLAEIDDYQERFPDEVIGELLAHIDELTRQLDDARDKAINAGIFTSSDGDESKYTHERNTDECEGCGWNLVMEYCYRCETGASTPGATSYKP